MSTGGARRPAARPLALLGRGQQLQRQQQQRGMWAWGVQHMPPPPQQGGDDFDLEEEEEEGFDDEDYM